MPRPSLPVDWDAIRSLYLQGVEPIEIANRFCIHLSTLQSKIYRKKWNLIKANGKQTIAKVQERGAEIARDIWSDRRETIRENIHTIGHKMTAYAAQMPEDQLLAKADKVKIAADIASKIVGLDREEDRNQVNIAILGAIGSGPGTYGEIVEGEVLPQSATMLPATE